MCYNGLCKLCRSLDLIHKVGLALTRYSLFVFFVKRVSGIEHFQLFLLLILGFQVTSIQSQICYVDRQTSFYFCVERPRIH